ncbi:hypothetical protein LI328DRAFT_80614 [Trichoderma asperelloides]|nr:hypothetical protein LI328DRAFT_80614 [Trichoderma asperelloides]
MQVFLVFFCPQLLWTFFFFFFGHPSSPSPPFSVHVIHEAPYFQTVPISINTRPYKRQKAPYKPHFSCQSILSNRSVWVLPNAE